MLFLGGVSEWFDDYENDVNHMQWPLQLPDLNPIEKDLTHWTALFTAIIKTPN